jgi:DNA-3-methyladenine glycosylase II
VSQQISSKAAKSINLRLIAAGGDPHSPERLIELGEARLRSVGLSGPKARYVLNLASAVVAGDVPLDDFDDTWDDDAIIESLTAVKGIGVWTAEMFLIFVMNRPDVLPTSDLGVRAALRDRHCLAQLPAPRDCPALAESWRPYRTVASWYLWRCTDQPKPTPDRGEPAPASASDQASSARPPDPAKQSSRPIKARGSRKSDAEP